LLLCGASTKQARLPQQARAGEAVGYLSNEPSSFVDFLGLVSNIIIEGSANPVPHSAQRCGSSCCGSVYRWWASISSMGKKAGKLKLPLPFASVAPGIWRRMGRRIGGPPDLRDWQPWMNQTKDPEALRRRARGGASALLQPLPARRLRRAAAVRSQICWRTADASTDERHRQALLDVGPIGQMGRPPGQCQSAPASK